VVCGLGVVLLVLGLFIAPQAPQKDGIAAGIGIAIATNTIESRSLAVSSDPLETIRVRSSAKSKPAETETETETETTEPLQQPPLKLFLMVGQSNTVGHGFVDVKDDETGSFRNGTLEHMVETDPETYGKLKTRDQNGTVRWTERDDVWITYNRQYNKVTEPESNQQGPLAAGFGGDQTFQKQGKPGWNPKNPMYDVPGHEIGPELGFGWTIGDAMGKQNHQNEKGGVEILLLKVAWGGKSLHEDFRPPSKDSDDLPTGRYYLAVLANIRQTLSRLSDIVPGYTDDRGYEIEGLAWNQGWNDGLTDEAAFEYESNLADFIRDIRTDLEIPDLPVVIGVSGMCGWHLDQNKKRKDRLNAVIEAQFAVANYPEFEDSVASVETRDFHREAMPYSPGDEKYHWNNNCESYWLIGKAMGEAMVDLVLWREAIRGGHQR